MHIKANILTLKHSKTIFTTCVRVSPQVYLWVSFDSQNKHSIISLNKITGLDSVMDMQNRYYGIENYILYIIQMKSMFKVLNIK